MSAHKVNSLSEMREYVLSQNAPVVLKGKISDWEILKWNEKDWCMLFQQKTLPFRCGLRKCTPVPQWERSCTTQEMTLDEFFQTEQSGSSDSWKYFDYKHINQWLKDTDALKSLSWFNLGFPEIMPSDCTLWIGSSGAHTPCHMDSYGSNLIAQVYGQKQWILFPPSASVKLKMTRVPYEESSIYSSLNFNAPLENIYEVLDDAHIVTLSPGDVLYVPHHWWHYVENVDTAIAINSWVPLSGDNDDRMNEVLVRLFVSSLIPSLHVSHISKILNPNEDDLGDTSPLTILNQVELCIQSLTSTTSMQKEATAENSKICKPDLKRKECALHNEEFFKSEKSFPECSKRQKIFSADIDSEFLMNSVSICLDEDFKDVQVLTPCSPTELKTILDAKCKCRSREEHLEAFKPQPCADSLLRLVSTVINSFAQPEVLDIVKKQILREIAPREL